MDVIYLEQTDSTNAYLHSLNNKYNIEKELCVVADFQTAGHGQASNGWESEKGKNLLFSIYLRPDAIAPSEQFVITEFVTLAIVGALQTEINQPITVKWPNDIYIGDRKLCGILIENSLCGNRIESSIIGIGININQSEFHSDAPNPVSLSQISGKNHDRKALLQAILDNITDEYHRLEKNNTAEYREALYQRYFASLYRRQGFYPYTTVSGERINALIESVGSQGHLTLVTDSGSRRTFAFKEVAFNI